MRRQTCRELLKNPAWMWVFGIGAGGLVVCALLWNIDHPLATWGKYVCCAIAVGFLMFAYASMYKKE